uniref:Uncharacterized protein n=1 Tax=Cryptomonas curvata TaxID=233186 RepID=A0A7S0ME23_9CRYP|mmetsp:Transcript_35513/g.74324  ORF Transcript_35513/g.74324 Transcript_35513/m.74324 type:complete len:406 (+) Transcript_35513:49-1266(+)
MRDSASMEFAPQAKPRHNVRISYAYILAGVVFASVLCAALVLDSNSASSSTELVQKQSPAYMQWLHTLKGAESFLDAADKGQLPAKSIVPESLSSVAKLLKKTKEQIHREATRLSSLEEPDEPIKTPYGAKKVALLTAPGEENGPGTGFLGLARRDIRPGQVMREVTDLVDNYKAEEDAAAKSLLRTIASKIVDAFDTHGLTAAQVARQFTDDVDSQRLSAARQQTTAPGEEGGAALQMPVGGITSDTMLGQMTGDVGVADCTDNPGLPKSSKFCLEGRPYTKLPGLGSAMTTGDMRGKIEELKRQARKNLGLPNADKVDQEELGKLRDIVESTKTALDDQEEKLAEIRKHKAAALKDLEAQKKVLTMAKDARTQRLAWRRLDHGLTTAYKDAGFQLPLSAGFGH